MSETAARWRRRPRRLTAIGRRRVNARDAALGSPTSRGVKNSGDCRGVEPSATIALGTDDVLGRMPDATFEIYEDDIGQYRWRLVHTNGNIIADSGEGYASKQKARQGLNSVKENAPDADIEEVDE
ncbi:hypothetical protein GCM10009000_124260 [Halobacterium noricense]